MRLLRHVTPLCQRDEPDSAPIDLAWSVVPVDSDAVWDGQQVVRVGVHLHRDQAQLATFRVESSFDRAYWYPVLELEVGGESNFASEMTPMEAWMGPYLRVVSTADGPFRVRAQVASDAPLRIVPVKALPNPIQP